MSDIEFLNFILWRPLPVISGNLYGVTLTDLLKKMDDKMQSLTNPTLMGDWIGLTCAEDTLPPVLLAASLIFDIEGKMRVAHNSQKGKPPILFIDGLKLSPKKYSNSNLLLLGASPFLAYKYQGRVINQPSNETQKAALNRKRKLAICEEEISQRLKQIRREVENRLDSNKRSQEQSDDSDNNEQIDYFYRDKPRGDSENGSDSDGPEFFFNV